MRNRSNLLVLLGIAFFVVGGLIVYVVSNDDGGDGGSSAAPGQTVVVVATHDIPAGAKGTDEIKNGGLKEKTIPAGALVPGAIQSLQVLDGATLVNAVADGEQVLQAGVQQVKRGYQLPDGYEAIAVHLSFAQGVAGYVSPGDRVNLYGVYSPGVPVKGTTPRAELLLTNVQVLDTSSTIPANGVGTDGSAATSRSAGSDIVYLLAVKTDDAEKIVFGTSFEQLYASLVSDDAAPSGPTGGISGDNVLAEEPNVAANS